MAHAGVRHVDMPMTPDRVWSVMNEAGLTLDPAERFDFDAGGTSADD
jgi:carbon-monoxide dehydrogenase large subunit